MHCGSHPSFRPVDGDDGEASESDAGVSWGKTNKEIALFREAVLLAAGICFWAS